jgi:hypothetical protein
VYYVKGGYVVHALFVGEWWGVGGDVFKILSKMAL